LIEFFIQGAGLFYLAEIIEEYATVAKKYLNYLIVVSIRIQKHLFLVSSNYLTFFNKD